MSLCSFYLYYAHVKNVVSSAVPSKLTISLKALLESVDYSPPSQSETHAALTFHSLTSGSNIGGSGDSGSDILFGPVPSFGPSVLSSPSSGVGGESCCRLLHPIYMPTAFMDAHTSAPYIHPTSTTSSRSDKNCEGGVIVGYVLCECERKISGSDVAALMELTKLTAFVALAHSRR